MQPEAYTVGTKVFIPRITEDRKEVQCPDCLDTRTWTITTPAGQSREIKCPRCTIGNHTFQPTRGEIAIVIEEEEITEVTIKSAVPYRSETGLPETSIEYKCGHYQYKRHGSVFLDRDEAERAGRIMLFDRKAKDHQRWEDDIQRRNERAGQNIFEALKAEADKATEELDGKVEALREAFLEAVRHPSLDGPKLTRLYRGGDYELTQESLKDWIYSVFSEANLDWYGEDELREKLCEC